MNQVGNWSETIWIQDAMKTFEDFLNEHLKNPKFKAEWDALESEYTMIRQQLNAEQAILKILDEFDPEDWDALIGENSYIMAVKRGKIAEKKAELVAPLMKRVFDVD